MAKTFYVEGFVDEWMGLELDYMLRYEIKEDEDIDLVVNSGGGNVQIGLSIYEKLKRHKGNITAYIAGFAASMASIIPLAADEVILGDGAVVMIHDPIGGTQGNAKAHLKKVEILDKLTDSLVSIYKNKLSISKEEVRAMMENETWMNADEALSIGWGDRKETVEGTNNTQSVINSIAACVINVDNAPENIKNQINELKNSSNHNEKTEVKNSMSQKNTEAPTASTTAEDLEAVKMQAVEDAKNAEKQRMESIKAVFAGNGLENNSKMNELLMDMDSGEIDALKACAEILKNSLEEAKSSAHQKTLAEKELEQRAQDDNDLQGVCNPSESNGGESNFDAQAFVNGYDSVARGDIGG